MTLFALLGGLFGTAGIVAVFRLKAPARPNHGPLQLGVGTKIRTLG